MKRYVILLVCIVAVASLSYILTQRLMPAPQEDQLTWLKREFHLTADQATAISKLQDAYQPICAEHCRLIREAHEQTNPAPADIARLEQVCHDATMKHLREIAAVMPASEGPRFLAMVEPKVTRSAHEGPIGLQ